MLTHADRLRGALLNSAVEIRQMLEPFDADQITFSLSLHSEDPQAMKLLRWYERLIMLCKLDYDRYYKVKVEEQKKLAKYIEDNNLRHCWAELVNYAIMRADTNRYVSHILLALVNEMGDTWLAFTAGTKNLVVGVTKDGSSWITRPDRFHGWADESIGLTLKMLDKKITMDSYIERMQKLITPQMSQQEQEERDVNRILFNMIPFFNEKTIRCMPTNWVSHSTYFVPHVRRYFSDGDSAYLEMLKKRKYMLNSRGVKAKLKNAGIFKEFFFMEDITSFGEFYAVFKVTFVDGKETCGVLSPNIDGCFLGFQSSTNSKAMDELYFLVMEVYADLTCDFDKPIKRKLALKEVETFDDPALNNTNLYVIYEEYTPPEERKGTRKGGPQSSHWRGASTRKLAPGREASEEAIRKAKEFGIELKPGETFVQRYWVEGGSGVRREI